MAVTQYIGARYVPLIMGDWDNTLNYEPLSVVIYQGNSYTSRQSVPAGIAITNTDYWVKTGDYNAQVATYVAQVTSLSGDVDDLEDALPIASFDNVNTVSAAISGISDVLPLSDFDSVNTVKAAIDAVSGGASTAITDLQNALPIASFDAVNTVEAAISGNASDISTISDVLPLANFDSVNTVKAAIDAEALTRSNADTTANNKITAINNFLPLGFSTMDRMETYIVDEGVIEDPTYKWYYRKLANDMIEVWGIVQHSGHRIKGTADGYGYFTEDSFQETFPNGLFAEDPEFVLLQAYTSSSQNAITGVETIGAPTATKTQTYWVYRIESGNIYISFVTCVYAVGKWR